MSVLSFFPVITEHPRYSLWPEFGAGLWMDVRCLTGKWPLRCPTSRGTGTWRIGRQGQEPGPGVKISWFLSKPPKQCS